MAGDIVDEYAAFCAGRPVAPVEVRISDEDKQFEAMSAKIVERSQELLTERWPKPPFRTQDVLWSLKEAARQLGFEDRFTFRMQGNRIRVFPKLMTGAQK